MRLPHHARQNETESKLYHLNAVKNKCVFSFDLKDVSEVDVRISYGKLFHKVGAATATIQRVPLDELHLGTTNKISCADLSSRKGT